MNSSIRRSRCIPLSVTGLFVLLAGCQSADSAALSPDAGPADSSSAPANPTSTLDAALFGARPTMQVTAPAATTADPFPDGYAGPTADTPIVTCDYAVGTGESPLLDDFEDLEENTLATDGRNGSWYFYDDETGGERAHTFTADPTGERPGGVLNVTGSNFNDWGSGFGAGLQWNPVECLYDASHYAGIRFWARGTGSPRVALQNPSVRPIALGGACPDDARCFDSHGVNLKLSAEWTLFELPFTEFAQAEWGLSVGTFDPSQIYILEFQLGANAPYEVWLDDVSFFEAEAPVTASPDAGSDAGFDGAAEPRDSAVDAPETRDAHSEADAHNEADAQADADSVLHP